jgi:hypothetical protein
MTARVIVGLALWASGCAAPPITPPPIPQAFAPADAVASGPDASPDALAGGSTAEDLGPVRTVYTESVPFTNKTTVEVVSVRPACRLALVEVACAPPALTEWRSPPPVSCPALALDVIDYENGALIERWIASAGASRYFTRFEDVEGGRPLGPPAGLGDWGGTRCDDPHPASSLGAEIERVAANDERRIIELGDPERGVWKRWTKSTRDGVPAKIDRAELTALEAGSDTAGWSPDGKHFYVSERWDSRCLYDLLIEPRAGEAKATRRSMCLQSTDDAETTYALSPDRRSAVRLTTFRDAGDVTAYALLDLASDRICKRGQLDLDLSEMRQRPELSDEGILWIARDPPDAPLLVDLTSGREAPVDTPPRVGVRGGVYAAMRPGPGIAVSAAVLWMGGGHALTTRATVDGRTAVVLVDAHALLPEARGAWRAACVP